MTRCALTRRTWLAPALAWALMAAALPCAQAQVARNFPYKALRGKIAFGTPPAIALNGTATQLAPGARIHDTANMLVVSGALVGQTHVVNYTLDQLGQPLEVWILRPAEAAREPWPRTTAQAQAWTFNADAQTWTKP